MISVVTRLATSATGTMRLISKLRDVGCSVRKQMNGSIFAAIVAANHIN